MRIYYLTGYPPKTDTGGGGLANSALISEGENLGHRIEVYSKEGEVPKEAPDLYWLSNMNGRFSPEFLYTLPSNTPKVVQDDGYQNLCPQPTREYKLCFQDNKNIRGKLPIVNGKYLPPIDKWAPPGGATYNDPPCSEICRYDIMGSLLHGCNAAVFVSPMHYRIWSNIFPQVVNKSVIVEPLIDPELFKPTYKGECNRNHDWYLYVGTIAKGKGYLNCVRYADIQGAQLISVGDIHHTVRKNQVRNWQGHLPYNRLPLVYSRCGTFIHLPEWPEPQGRCVTEALLCGCRLILNDKVGAVTYDWLDQYITRDTYNLAGLPGNYQMIRFSRRNKEFTARIADAPRKFWRDVLSYI